VGPVEREAEPAPRPERSGETLSALLGEWRRLLTRLVDEAEQFARERPSAGLTAAFLAGLLLGSFLRRR